MKGVVFTQGQKNNVPAKEIVNEIFRLRYETFVDRLEWDISANDGLERDQFDEMAPFHIAVKNSNGGVDGCWRALPTTGDYMLRSVFPELLQGEQVPEASDIWEISRFAVRKGSSKVASGYMAETTVDMVRSFYDFAMAMNINSYVTVTTVACERLLRQLGVDIERLGERKAMRIGKELSVALRINVNAKLAVVKH